MKTPTKRAHNFRALCVRFENVSSTRDLYWYADVTKPAAEKRIYMKIEETEPVVSPWINQYLVLHRYVRNSLFIMERPVTEVKPLNNCLLHFTESNKL